MIQLQFLNYLLDSKDTSLLILNNIGVDFFSDYKAEYKFISEHIDNYGKVPDKETFAAKFPDFDFIAVNESSSYLIKALYDDKNTRFLADTFNNVRQKLMDGKIDEAMSIYSKASESLSKGVHLDCVDILRDTTRYDAYVEKCSDFGKYYIKTGFPELDQIIGGWDRNEELATIVARSGTGKSWCLLKTAIAAAQQGLRVGIYSGEMSEGKVGYRVDTLISHISNGQLVHGNISAQVEYKKYIDNVGKTIPGAILVLTPAMISGPAGVNALRAFVEKEKLDMLCVDQHSLLEDDRKAKNPVERASNISKDLKNLQVLKKIPIISVSQQNRTSTENGVDLTHISQADRIGQDSTVVLILEQKDKIMTVNLVKSRDSANGKSIKYAVDLDKGQFTYIPDEEDALGGPGAQELENRYKSETYTEADVDIF